MTADVIFPMLLTIAVATGSYFMPRLQLPTVPFGVRIPPSRMDDPSLTHAGRQYRRITATAGVIGVAAGFALSRTASLALGLLGFAVVLAGTGVAWVVAHRHIRGAKQTGDWYRDLKQAVVVDTSLRTAPDPFPWLWLVPPIAVLVGTAVAFILGYPSLPDPVPVHADFAGRPDRWMPKSPAQVAGPVLVTALTALLLVAAAVSVHHTPARLDPWDPERAAAEHRRHVRRSTRLLLLIAAVVCAMTGVLTYAVQHQLPIGTGGFLLVTSSLLAPLALMVVAFLQNRRALRALAEEAAGTSAVARDDDRFWRLAGTLYVNPDDPVGSWNAGPGRAGPSTSVTGPRRRASWPSWPAWPFSCF